RHILHADLDASYAAVEQLDNPDLRGKPVLVGGTSGRQRSGGHGFVRSPRVRRPFGNAHENAVRLCPQGIIVRPRFQRYRELSKQVMDIFRSFTPLVEPLSLDEAYLDITERVQADNRAPLRWALRLKSQVSLETGLTVSVGAATSKSVAKIASDIRKPDGLVVVEPGDERAFLEPLGRDRYGVLAKDAEKLGGSGRDRNVGQLAQQTKEWHTRQFGKSASASRPRPWVRTGTK
ncbi:DNA polymerase IV, partial [Geodia barretti]